MNVKKQVPEIRFKGFSGEWLQPPLDEISDVLDGDRGHNYPNGDDLKSQGHTLFLSASNITKNGFKLDTKQYITQEKSESLGNGKLLQGDILLTSRGSIGHIAWYNQDICKEVPFARINSGMLILRAKSGIDPSVVSYYLKSYKGKNKIDLISFGSAQPQLTKASVVKLSVSIPCLELEQTAIGNYFQKLDSLISQHQQKHDQLNNIKKAMLEKMFPKHGATMPEIRFQGFTGEWEEKKLGEIAIIKTGSSNREDSGLNGKYTFFDRSEETRTSDIYLFNCEAIIVAGEGSDFIPKYFTGKFDLHQRSYAIMEFKKCYGKYLLYYIYLFRKHFLDHAVGSTVKSLRLPMFKEMIVKIPSTEEQTAIGNYFQKLDTLINQHQQQITKLNNIKQACLSKMFV